MNQYPVMVIVILQIKANTETEALELASKRVKASGLGYLSSHPQILV
jgi:hypothetical protein